MKTRTWYTVDAEHGSTDQRTVSADEAVGIVEDYVRRQKNTYETGEEAIADSIFGFCIDEKNYLEVSIDSKTDYRIKHGRSTPKSLWFLKWTGLYEKEYGVNSTDILCSITRDYFLLSQDDFLDSFETKNLKEAT